MRNVIALSSVIIQERKPIRRFCYKSNFYDSRDIIGLPRAAGTFSFIRLKADSELEAGREICVPSWRFKGGSLLESSHSRPRISENQGMPEKTSLMCALHECKQHFKPSNKACGRHSSGWCSPILEKMNNSLPEKGLYYSFENDMLIAEL